MEPGYRFSDGLPYFYTEDVSFISDCTVENVRDKNDKTVLYCGMTATDGPEMFECMDAALNSGAQALPYLRWQACAHSR